MSTEHTRAEVPPTAGSELPGLATSIASPVLVASDLWKAYRRGWWPRRRTLQVLKGANLVIAPGEIVGLVGENGSGKSTVMKVLVGDLTADTGTIEGAESFRRRRRRCRRGLGD